MPICTLNRIGVEFDPAIVEEPGEPGPAGKRIADGFGEHASLRDVRQLRLELLLRISDYYDRTGSFDHCAIVGADGAQLMQAFKQLVKNPFGMLA